MEKTKYLVAALALSLLQACGQPKDNSVVGVEGICPAMAIAPMQLKVNGTNVQDLATPIVLPAGQDIAFTTADFLGAVSCGPTDGSMFWTMNGGSKVNDRCSIFASPAAGTYTIKFTQQMGTGKCFTSEVQTIDFEVQ